MIDASDALHARVRAFIARGGDFDPLACDIARFQARSVAAVNRLFQASGIDPSRLTRAADIPAMPTDAFRLRRIAAHDESLDARVFETSGTTQRGKGEQATLRGRHAMRTTETYRAAALRWGDEMLLRQRDVMFVGLAADQATAPSSSLSFMLARFAETLQGPTSWHWDGASLDVAGIVSRLREPRMPALIAGTSFAFVHLLDALGATRLPQLPGTRVMQTGGYKGRSREVDAGVLRGLIAACFAIAQQDVIAEYGMTELSSQLYELDGHYRPPPWLRVTAVDPEKLTPVPRGQAGIARFVDLANVDSAVAIQTADVIRVKADGVVLEGRLPGAPPRGCSLALDHLVGDP